MTIESRRAFQWKSFCVRLATISTLASFAASSTFAAEEQMRFLRALQSEGYGALSLVYLDSLHDRNLVGPELKGAWETERAESMRIAAQETREPAARLRLLSEVSSALQANLKKSDKGLPLARLHRNIGAAESDIAKAVLEMSGETRSAKLPDGAMKDYRRALEKAKNAYGQSVAVCRGLMEKPDEEPLPSMSGLPAAKEKSTARRKEGEKPAAASPGPESREKKDARELAIESQFNQALAGYTLAQSYPDQTSPQRRDELDAAAKLFDDVYQRNRIYRVGLIAHLWYGKTMEELRQRRTALDIYDEVLGGAPSVGKERPSLDMEAIFAEAERSRLHLLASVDRAAEVADEADKWIEENEPARSTEGFQGVLLEQAKSLIALSARQKDGEGMMGKAIDRLTEMTKTPSSYRDEASKMLQRYAKGNRKATADSFEEAMGLARASATSGNYDDALAGYRRAAAMAKEKGEANQEGAAKFAIARILLARNRYDEASEAAEQVARERPNAAYALPAAMMALRTTSATASTAKDKEAAKKRVAALVDFIASQWSNRPEAEEAKIIRGETALALGEYDAAVEIFDSFSASSSAYKNARLLAAQTVWRKYREEKKKPTSERDEGQLKELRERAFKIVVSALSVDATKDSSAQLEWDARLRILLAEMQLDEGKADEAIRALAPLTANLENRGMMSKATAATALRATIRADLLTKDADSASKNAARLADLGDDSPQTVASVAEALRFLAAEQKRDPGDESRKRTITDILKKLDGKKLSLAAKGAVADAFLVVGEGNRADKLFKEIAEATKNDESLRGAEAAAAAQARRQMVASLLSSKKYADALSLTEQLLKDNPRSLAIQTTKARILQAWGEDADVKAEERKRRLQEAYEAWSGVRVSLAQSPQKPAEFFEAIYNAASCAVAISQNSQDKSRLADARKLLKTTLTLYPQLGGNAGMKGKYEELLKKCRTLEERIQ